MIPAIAFVGWSGSGKTTLLERLLPAVRALGHRPGYLKGSHHGFQMDHEGKDSDRLFRCGAERVVVASPVEGALRFRIEKRKAADLIAEHFSGCDLVLVEGFKGSELPMIEVRRGGDPVLEGGDPRLLAIVSEEADDRPAPRYRFDDLDGLARLVVEHSIGRMRGPR